LWMSLGDYPVSGNYTTKRVSTLGIYQTCESDKHPSLLFNSVVAQK
jgi:hypothetical protein